MRRALAGLGMIVLLLVGCGGTSESSNRERRAVDLGQSGRLGDFVITVTALRSNGSDFGAWLDADVRVTNPSDSIKIVPFLQLVCANDPQGGSFRNTTLPIYFDLGPGQSVEGTVELLLPHDEGGPWPTPVCRTPAYVRAGDALLPTAPTDPYWRVRDDLVAELNSTAAAARR